MSWIKKSLAREFAWSSKVIQDVCLGRSNVVFARWCCSAGR